MSAQVAKILQEGKPFLVGKWLVEPSLNRLTRGELSVQLELRAIDVLLCLVEHAGEVVGKDTLLDTVWRTEFVSDNTLMSRIGQLRNALGDDAQNPRYIETIRKRGYRLIAEVRPYSPPSDASPAVPESRPSLEEEPNPYPGLASFTEADADRFFGREAEAAALWRKISARRLLAVIGPSGVGKSSLLRAGVAARAPPGWRVLVFTPGENPALSLARALAPDHAGDPTAMARLLGFSDADTVLAVVSRWRGQFEEAVLVVDQFEELFTLNPPEVRASFIALLRRLVEAADVHVVLSMRDDYLYRCQEHRQISPIFDAITPLAPPNPEGLRRALKEPAARQLYRFESEVLVDRMIAEVEGERGALPLMAFAVRRLWEERDREELLLTGEAYERIGGVAGALAKHADATLERVGAERLPIVRELFRNLVTAEGTRAVREVDDLLSVFPEGQREPAEQVLRGLIDARLLTGYREQDDDEHPTRRVEIVHESLLTSWPRLVRWQTQDADSARLRDELRQAARIWDDHERASDYLWTSKAFRELSVWRESYPGGLTAIEEQFADASTAHARRRARRRRLAAAALLVAATAVAVVFGILWRQGVLENRRAEAQKLVALGQLRLEDYPTATLAHAIASLELADTLEARRLALRALWEGPTALVVNEDQSRDVAVALGGNVLVQAIQGAVERHLRAVDRDGTNRLLEQTHDETGLVNIDLNPDGTVLYSQTMGELGIPQHFALWSLPDGIRLSDQRFPPGFELGLRVIGWNPNRLVMLVREGDQGGIYAFGFDGTRERLGTVDPGTHYLFHVVAIDSHAGRWVAVGRPGGVLLHQIGGRSLSEPRFFARPDGDIRLVAFDVAGRLLAGSAVDGRITVWDVASAEQLASFRGPPGALRLRVLGDVARIVANNIEDGRLITWIWSLGDGGSRLTRRIESAHAGSYIGTAYWDWTWDPSKRLLAKSGPDKATRIWRMESPVDAAPIILRRGDVGVNFNHAFFPDSEWLVSADGAGLTMWPLSVVYPVIIRAHGQPVWALAFGPDGAWLASGGLDGHAWLTPLVGEVPLAGREVYRGRRAIRGMAASPDGTRLLLAADGKGATVMVPLDVDSPASLETINVGFGGAFSSDGRFAAVAGYGNDNIHRLYVVNTDTSQTTASFDLQGGVVGGAVFLKDGRILSAGPSGLFMSDPETGRSESLSDGFFGRIAVAGDGRRIAYVAPADESFAAMGPAFVLDLDTGARTELKSHGARLFVVATDEAGAVVASGGEEGTLRVGPIGGEEPHLLLGHEGRIWAIEIDPRGRWIATGGDDGTVRIWPMPDLSKPPLHTLPHDELVAKLKTLTNLRVVRDKESPTGWTLTHDPFPGWETVPTW